MTRFVNTLGGLDIKQPKPGGFGIEKYDLTKSGRVASGKMKIEIIAKKRKFTFNYDVISGAHWDQILSIVDSNTPFFVLNYTENGVVKSATCYAGAKKAILFRTDGGWYWKNATFDLIEQ